MQGGDNQYQGFAGDGISTIGELGWFGVLIGVIWHALPA